MTGNNTPVFFIRDPLKFGDFIHTQKRDPETNLKSPTMMWDFWSLSPESLHQVTILFSDPRDTGRLPAHGRIQQPHVQPDQCQERALLREVALQDQARDQEFLPRAGWRDGGNGSGLSQRDLFHAIKKGDFPKWRVCVQIMPEKGAETYHINRLI